MIILILMGLCLLGAASLVAAGGRTIRRGVFDGMTPSIGSWPDVALVVPAAGAAPELPKVVQSLLCQDYSTFQTVFVTRDAADPATDMIRETARDHPGVKHVLSGKASGCGQKNHNLLQGLAALRDKPEILVFCDSTRIAPPSWLKALVAPVVRGEVEITSGYHHVVPRDNRFSTLGHALSVLILYLTKGIPFLNQPWGGGTAVRRETFECLGVEQIWSRNVVDDVSLAALLKRERIKVGLSTGASMATPLKGETMGSWLHWLIRQWFYLKVCMPGSWLAAGLTCYLFSAILVLAAVGALGVIPGLATGLQALVSMGFLCLFAALVLVLGILHPDPGPLFRWLVAALLTPPVAAWAHMLTLFTMKITWQGIHYRVKWRGVVESVEEGG
jgi:cellulose synthase/poly-beta-1,6-N-acetylglucosamine synthase-like glycosyltransferase